MSEFTASGGWCAPSETLYDPYLWPPVPPIVLPEVKVARGGVTFPTPEETEASRLMTEARQRMVNRLIAQQNRTIDFACSIALARHWDLTIHYPQMPYSVHYADDRAISRLNYLGIAFTPAKHAIPTIHERRNSDLDEFDWDD